MMKNISGKTNFGFAIAITVILCVLPRAHARLGITVDANRDSYVRYEKIKLTVMIANYTGNKIKFGHGETAGNHLSFGISNNEGRSYKRIDASGLLKGLELKPGESRQVKVVANHLYDFEDEHEYLMYVQVGHTRLPTDYRSKPLTVHIRDGITLWSRQIGVPVDDEDGPIPMRNINMMQVQQTKNEIYCLRIEDDKKVYAVLRLGEVMRGASPQCQVDAVSNIHVLLRIKSRLYIYRAYDYRGKLLQTSYHMLSDTRPELYRDSDEGTITVVGGRPAILGEDYILGPDEEGHADMLPDAIRRRPSPQN